MSAKPSSCYSQGGYIPRNEALCSLLEKKTNLKSNSVEGDKYFGSGISNAAGKLIGDLVLAHGVKSVLEIGLANGFSTLFILDALEQGGGGSLISLDPYQYRDWKGAGLKRVEEAGCSCAHVFIERFSWQALPEMINDNKYVDLAFIDGSHSFDNAFVDFYLIDRLLKNEGLLVFDDVGWAGVERVVHYAVVNRDYEILLTLPRQRPRRERLLHPVKVVGSYLGRTHRSPRGEDVDKIKVVNNASVIALLKSTDRNTEDRFRPF